MTDLGLRERKKARTRQVIAAAAARLVAERGYEQVAVSDVVLDDLDAWLTSATDQHNRNRAT